MPIIESSNLRNNTSLTLQECLQRQLSLHQIAQFVDPGILRPDGGEQFVQSGPIAFSSALVDLCFQPASFQFRSHHIRTSRVQISATLVIIENNYVRLCLRMVTFGANLASGNFNCRKSSRKNLSPTIAAANQQPQECAGSTCYVTLRLSHSHSINVFLMFSGT